MIAVSEMPEENDLIIEYANCSYNSTTIDEASSLLDSVEKHKIAFSHWNFDFSGSADFSIIHGQDVLLLKFFITEESILARHNVTNDPVHKDSCVELFIAFGGEDSYYSLEFNCKGNCQGGFGEGRLGRTIIPAPLLESIKTMARFKNISFSRKEMIKWELTLLIPIRAFHFHQFDSLVNQSVRLNLYKCGDDLPQPHYLAWRPIASALPNFHLPAFFGHAFFQSN